MTMIAKKFPTAALIDGQWVMSAGTFPVTDPATGAEVATVPNLGVAETRQAIDAAHRAFPTWSAKTAKERAAILKRWFDLVTAETERVNLDSRGQQANLAAAYATISADGRYVVFGSMATNLAPSDTNPAIDVFVRDRASGSTSMVDFSSSGEQANNYTSRGTISADGRYLAFKSTADNLVPGDTNGLMDIFVRDLEKGITRRVSVSSVGAQADGFSSEPTISADGRHVAYYSEAVDLVEHDTNWRWDVFVASPARLEPPRAQVVERLAAPGLTR